MKRNAPDAIFRLSTDGTFNEDTVKRVPVPEVPERGLEETMEAVYIISELGHYISRFRVTLNNNNQS